MFGPRSTGSPQGASLLARWETQMSAPPLPPGRGAGSEEVMYRLRPSLEIAEGSSSYGELTTGPRLTGVPHGPYAGWSSAAASSATSFKPPGPSTCLSELHASATAMSAQSRAILSIDFIGPLLRLIAST